MKHLSFLFILFIWLAVFACTNEISHQTETEHEQGIEQEQTEIKEPETRPPNEETPETEQTVIDPPITEPPETVRPEQPVTEPLEQVPQEVIPPIVELPIVEPPIIEPPEVIPPIIELPIVEPPIIEPPEIEEPETPEIIPPVVEPPTNALLVINELRTEYSSITRRYEFIEFKVKRSGSLHGIQLFIMSDPRNPFIYDFPAINVTLGEYITLHLRTPENNCVNELGDNLALSGGIDSCPTARDLWVSGSNKYLNRTDIVYLEDEGGNVMDAVVLSEKPSNIWGKDYSHFAEILELLFYEGMWKAANGGMPTPLDVVNTSSINSSTAKSVCRNEGRENSHTASDWYVTSGGTTPGLPNN
jgi:hypothetical protein